jgi:hypothetical protein
MGSNVVLLIWPTGPLAEEVITEDLIYRITSVFNYGTHTGLHDTIQRMGYTTLEFQNFEDEIFIRRGDCDTPDQNLTIY